MSGIVIALHNVYTCTYTCNVHMSIKSTNSYLLGRLAVTTPELDKYGQVVSSHHAVTILQYSNIDVTCVYPRARYMHISILVGSMVDHPTTDQQRTIQVYPVKFLKLMNRTATTSDLLLPHTRSLTNWPIQTTRPTPYGPLHHTVTNTHMYNHR